MHTRKRAHLDQPLRKGGCSVNGKSEYVMWIHYAIRCKACRAIGWGFDGSTLVYYNSGRLVHGNFKPSHEHNLHRANMPHVCQCGNLAIAQKIHYGDYKSLTKSVDRETAYETAVNNYKPWPQRESESMQRDREINRLLSEGAPLPFSSGNCHEQN